MPGYGRWENPSPGATDSAYKRAQGGFPISQITKTMSTLAKKNTSHISSSGVSFRSTRDSLYFHEVSEMRGRLVTAQF